MMQCKDIPDRPILEFLRRLERGEISCDCVSHGPDSVDGIETWQPIWGCVWNQVPHSVQHAMPKEVWGQERLVRAKMQSLIDRGLADGCTCGCRGDFELTDKGRALLGQDKEGTKEEES